MLLKYLGFSGLLCGLVACGGGSQSSNIKDNSPIISSSSNSKVDVSTSSPSSSSPSSSSSSSSSSSHENHTPEAKVAISIQGLTVHVDGSASTDPDHDPLTYSIDYGDGNTIRYGNAWHTYAKTGNYSVRFSVSDGKLTSDKVEVISIAAADTNHPPVARMMSFNVSANKEKSQYTLTSYGTLSYDEDKDPLTYTWDAAGSISQDKNATVVLDCNNPSNSSSSTSSAGAIVKPDQLITLTVGDGKVADTFQRVFHYSDCREPIAGLSDDTSRPNFTYRVDGLTVYLDARTSSDNTVSLHWDFGDDTSEGNYWLTSHTYKQAGTYKIALNNTTTSPSFFNIQPKEIWVTAP